MENELKIGQVVAGLEYTGGDPSVKSNWKQVVSPQGVQPQGVGGNADYAQRLGASITAAPTLGFGDEIGALLGAGASYLDPRPEAGAAFEGMGPIDRYSALWNQANSRQQGFQEEYPVTAVSSEMGAGLGTGVAAGGSKLVQELYRRAPASISGLLGGLSATGHGTSTDPMQRAVEIGAGVGGGAVLGKVAGGPRQTQQDDLVNKARSHVLRRLSRDDTTVDQASAQLRKMPEGGALADVGGENMRRLAEDVVQTPGKGANVGRRFFELRQQAAPVRVDRLLSRVLKTGDQNYHRTQQEITRRLQTASKPFYDEAEKLPINLSAPMRALNRRLMETDPKILSTAAKNIRRDGQVTGGEFAFWDQVKKGLDDAAGAAYRQGKKNLGNSYRDMARMVVDEVDQQFAKLSDDGVSVYWKARQTWRGEQKMMEALERGRKFLSEDAEDIAGALDDLSPGELEMFRLGAARQLRDKVLNRSETSDVYKAWFNKPLMREKIESLFDDWRDVAKLHRGMRSEQKMFETQTQATTGSPTARRLAGMQDLAKEVGTTTLYGDSKGAVVGGAKWLAKWFQDEHRLIRNEGLRTEIARIIFNGTPGEREAILRQAQMSKQLGVPFEQVYKPSIPITGAIATGEMVAQ